MIECKGIVKQYKTGERYKTVLDGVDFVLNEGETVAVTGDSGEGKTTLVNIMAGLVKPDSGEVFVDGKNIFNISQTESAILRREKLGIVVQDFALLNQYSVEENVAIALDFRKNDKAEKIKLIDDLLEKLGISVYKKTKLKKLSGGERQRVAIARAVIKNPGYVLADEPISALDEGNADKVFSVFDTLKNKGAGVLISTHDKSFADRCDKVFKLESGKLIQVK